jgi:hypothetical protein
MRWNAANRVTAKLRTGGTLGAMGRGKRLRLAERARQNMLLKMTVVNSGTDYPADDAISMANEVKIAMRRLYTQMK